MHVLCHTLFGLLLYNGVCGDTFTVRVGTEEHVNEVDERFLSFTVDPKYLFANSGKYDSQKCVCMASSLSPAYIRIAGPSTSLMTFHNATITFTDLNKFRPKAGNLKPKADNHLTKADEDEYEEIEFEKNKDSKSRSKAGHDRPKADSDEYEELEFDTRKASKSRSKEGKNKPKEDSEEYEEFEVETKKHSMTRPNGNSKSKTDNEESEEFEVETKKHSKTRPKDSDKDEEVKENLRFNLGKGKNSRSKGNDEAPKSRVDSDEDEIKPKIGKGLSRFKAGNEYERLKPKAGKGRAKRDADEREGSIDSDEMYLKKRVRVGKSEETEDGDEIEDLKVTHSQWSKFISWAKSTHFDLVFALNNQQKLPSGLWDPNTALDILTVAEKAKVQDIFWQLGYECRNQSIEEYLDDLETLRVIVETFPAGKERQWKVVGGDVTHCLQQDSKSDFKDYVTISDDMLDAVLLHDNSSAAELERLPDSERLQLLQRLTTSDTPLWLTESPHFTDSSDPESELNRAADWMTSLGYSARNGFRVHFRDLTPTELREPTLSFYMALLYKNLVGERVLDVSMNSSTSALFAHCTSLRHNTVPGAVTLYGVNMDDEPARFAVKLTRRQSGGDVMQFILGHDRNGNIKVNNRLMYYERDMRPVVKRLRPYRTLLINLPARSLGFWVLANTNVDACHSIVEDEYAEAETIGDSTSGEERNDVSGGNREGKKDGSVENKGIESMERNEREDASIADESKEDNNASINKRITNVNKDIKNVHKMLDAKTKRKEKFLKRSKRVADQKRSYKRQTFKNRRYEEDDESKSRFEWIRRLLRLGLKSHDTRDPRVEKTRRNLKNSRYNANKRHVKPIKVKESDECEFLNSNEHLRRKRSAINEKNIFSLKDMEESSENQIEKVDRKQLKMLRTLRKIHEELKGFSDEDITEYDDSNMSKDDEEIVLKTKMSDGATSINFKDNSKQGIFKSTINNVSKVLRDLNKNLRNFWGAFSLLE